MHCRSLHDVDIICCSQWRRISAVELRCKYIQNVKRKPNQQLLALHVCCASHDQAKLRLKQLRIGGRRPVAPIQISSDSIRAGGAGVRSARLASRIFQELANLRVYRRCITFAPAARAAGCSRSATRVFRLLVSFAYIAEHPRKY